MVVTALVTHTPTKPLLILKLQVIELLINLNFKTMSKEKWVILFFAMIFISYYVINNIPKDGFFYTMMCVIMTAWHKSND